jgi:hypothetical protein
MSLNKQSIISKLGAVGKPMQSNELLLALGVQVDMDSMAKLSEICFDGTNEIVHVEGYGWKLSLLSGFVAMYNGRQADVWATSLWDAKKKAIAVFKVHKRHEHLISVNLAIKADGSQHIISTAGI